MAAREAGNSSVLHDQNDQGIEAFFKNGYSTQEDKAKDAFDNVPIAVAASSCSSTNSETDSDQTAQPESEKSTNMETRDDLQGNEFKDAKSSSSLEDLSTVSITANNPSEHLPSFPTEEQNSNIPKATFNSSQNPKTESYSQNQSSSSWSMDSITESLRRWFCPTADDDLLRDLPHTCCYVGQQQRGNGTAAGPASLSTSSTSSSSSVDFFCFGFPCSQQVIRRSVVHIADSCTESSTQVISCSASSCQKDIERTRRILERDIINLLGKTSKEAVKWLRSLQTICTGMECFEDSVGLVEGGRFSRNRRLSVRREKDKDRPTSPSREVMRHRVSVGKDAQAQWAGFVKANLNPCENEDLEKELQLRSAVVASRSCDEIRCRGWTPAIVNTSPWKFTDDEDDAASTTSTKSHKSVYYDSDPGECFATEKRVLARTKRHRLHVSQAEREESELGRVSLVDRSLEEESFDEMGKKETHLDDNSDSLVSRSINYLTNGHVMLVWHPSPMREQRPQRRNSTEGYKIASKRRKQGPVCVKAWIERGSRLKDDKVLHPKFMWKSAIDDYKNESADRFTGDALKGSSSSRRLSLSWTSTPEGLDLLGIVRVLKPTQVDRKLFPLAKLSHCFTVTTYNEETYLFEALNQVERDLAVDSLKSAVARLTCKIMMGATDVLDEFYSPWSPATILAGNESLYAANQDSIETSESKESGEDARRKDGLDPLYYPTYEGVNLWGGD